MAKILYGVAGEGFGHSSRSHLTANRLRQAGHDVLFAASNKSYGYLAKYFPGAVTPIHGLTFNYQNGAVSLPKTFFSNLAGVGAMIKTNYTAFTKTYREFAPDVVITDFEPFTSFWAYWHNVPCISVDHEHFLSKCEFEMPRTSIPARLSSKYITKYYLTGVHSHIVLNFFKADTVNDRVKLTGPVIRDALSGYKPCNDGDFIIVYATSETCLPGFLELAKQFPSQKFYLYGFSIEGERGNCLFKKHDGDEFLYDLSRCRGVVATGGFSLISECLYYRKKMYIKPIDRQVEQMINAYHMEKTGGGMCVSNLTKSSLQSFLNSLDEPYELDWDNVLLPDNDKYFSLLSNSLEKITDGRVSLPGLSPMMPWNNNQLAYI
jgi:uncharacterized protein (TIGR00661 family)